MTTNLEKVIDKSFGYSLPILSHCSSDFINSLFGLNENDRLVFRFQSNFINQHTKPASTNLHLKRSLKIIKVKKPTKQLNRHILVFLFVFLTNINNLKNTVIRRERCRSNIDLNVVLQKVFGKSTNLFWPSCGPHQSLAIGLQYKIII